MKDNSKVTIQDVANRANVSIATVSRAINSKGNVKKETIDKIFAAIDELHYSISAIHNPPNNTILICVPEFGNLFSATVLDGIQACARKKGYNTLIFQVNGDLASKQDFQAVLSTHEFAGIIILAAVKNKKYLSELSLSNNVVICSGESEKISCVTIDNRAAAKEAVEYLICSGKRKLGLINHDLTLPFCVEREQAFIDTLRKHNIEYNPDWMIHLSTFDSGMACSSTLTILRQDDKPDAILATSDVFAIGAVAAAQMAGLSIPADLSVLGFDNISLSSIGKPAISTMSQPGYKMGYKACDLLFERMDNPRIKPRKVIFETELIIRETT